MKITTTDPLSFKTEFKNLFDRNFSFWVRDLSPFKQFKPGEVESYLKFKIIQWLDGEYAVHRIIDSNYTINVVSTNQNEFKASVVCKYYIPFKTPFTLAVASSASRSSKPDAAAKILTRVYEDRILYSYRYEEKKEKPANELVYKSLKRMHKKLSKP